MKKNITLLFALLALNAHGSITLAVERSSAPNTVKSNKFNLNNNDAKIIEAEDDVKDFREREEISLRRVMNGVDEEELKATAERMLATDGIGTLRDALNTTHDEPVNRITLKNGIRQEKKITQENISNIKSLLAKVESIYAEKMKKDEEETMKIFKNYEKNAAEAEEELQRLQKDAHESEAQKLAREEKEDADLNKRLSEARAREEQCQQTLNQNPGGRNQLELNRARTTVAAIRAEQAQKIEERKEMQERRDKFRNGGNEAETKLWNRIDSMSDSSKENSLISIIYKNYINKIDNQNPENMVDFLINNFPFRSKQIVTRLIQVLSKKIDAFHDQLEKFIPKGKLPDGSDRIKIDLSNYREPIIDLMFNNKDFLSTYIITSNIKSFLTNQNKNEKDTAVASIIEKLTGKSDKFIAMVNDCIYNLASGWNTFFNKDTLQFFDDQDAPDNMLKKLFALEKQSDIEKAKKYREDIMEEGFKAQSIANQLGNNITEAELQNRLTVIDGHQKELDSNLDSLFKLYVLTNIERELNRDPSI